ncbi:MAG: DUF2080 family transposase-associated protein [Candidatus Diapherotrites archaeon]
MNDSHICRLRASGRAGDRQAETLINKSIHVYTMLKTINIGESVEKEVVRFGNGSIVYTPKRWIGKKVLVILEERPLDISAEVMEALKPHLGDVQGVFLFGSFARGEQHADSDIDVLVVSDAEIGPKKRGRLDFSAMAKARLAEAIKHDPTLFWRQAVQEAKPIFNASLLEELRGIKPEPDFKELLGSTLGAFKNTEELLAAERKEGREYLDSAVCIYSLILRMRALFNVRCFLKGGKFSNAGFVALLKSHGFGKKEAEAFMQTYRAVRGHKKTEAKITLPDAERLFEAAKIDFLKTEEALGNGRKKEIQERN